jgi:hypothetical protein
LKYRVEPEKPPEKPPEKQPRKKPQKPVEASKSPTKTATNAPAKTKKTKKRVLKLHLPDVPPGDYEKYLEDWSLPDNPYWEDNFYAPQDNTTQEYTEATENRKSTCKFCFKKRCRNCFRCKFRIEP